MIKGFIGTSLIDFPGIISSVVFFGGCNYRCPFCQNSWLVSESKLSSLPAIESSEVLKMVIARSGITDGVVLSGGEPTLFSSLISTFITDLRKNEQGKRLKVKLDTNGSYPLVLKDFLDKGLIDYVALDLKTSPSRYDSVSGLANSFQNVRESLQILSQSAVDSEVRTTFVPGIIDKAELLEMIPIIKEVKRYVLQPFRPKDTLDESFNSVTPYSTDYLSELAAFVRQQVSIEVIQR